MTQFILSSSNDLSTESSSDVATTTTIVLEDSAFELHYCGNILLGLESCLSKGDMLMFHNIVQDVIPSFLKNHFFNSNRNDNQKESNKDSDIDTVLDSYSEGIN